jgi:hypothetical protein
MEQISVKPIKTRKWKNPKKKGELVVERNRKIVNERIHYCWWHYLQLAMNLEQIKYSIVKLGVGGKVLGDDTKVKVNRKIYKDWDLEEVRTSTFTEWYKNPKHQSLFGEGGFKYSKGSQYHALIKRFNTFINYHNKMNEGEDDGKKKDKMKICEDIIVENEKERYELLEREQWGNGTSFQKRVQKDLLACEKTILAVCQGEFCKSSV